MALGRGKRVIMVGGEGVVLFAPSGGGMVRETSFSWDIPNFEEQLAAALASQNQSKPAVIIFDGADQTYRKEENLPKLSMVDRTRFVKRKLEMAFPAYPVRGALEIKPPKTARGAAAATPSYLFIALPETENLDRVGQALFDSGSPVAGCGLLPTESSALVTEMSAKLFGGGEKKSRWAVLIGQHETGGLRQVVVKDGNLALTRLTPPTEAGTSGAGWADNVTREFRATMNYISRFGFNPNDGLDVMIICGNVEKQFFDAKEMSVGNFTCVTVSEALKAIGSPSQGFDKTNFADVVHAAWVSKKGSLKFPIALPTIRKIMGPRQAVRFGTVGMIVSAVAFAGLTIQSYLGYQEFQGQIEQKQNQKAMLEREYKEESKVFDGLPVKLEVVKATLAIKTLTEKNTVNFPPILDKLKRNFGKDVLLEEISFEHIPDTALNLNVSSGGNGAPVAPPKTRPGEAPREFGTVKLRFKFTLPPEMTLENKVKRTEVLAGTLKSDFPGYRVDITSQFGRVKRGGKFTGDVQSSSAAPEAAGSGIPGQPAKAENDYAEIAMEGPAS